MTRRRFSSLSFVLALGLVAGGSARSEDAFGGIVAPVYLPEGNPAPVARVAPPAAKSAVHLVTENELIGRLQEELTKHFNPDGELRLSFARPWPQLRVSSEDWTVTLPEFPIGGLSKSFMVRVRISDGDRVWFDQQLVVAAELWKSVLVATRRLERGQALDASAAEVQTVDVLHDRLATIPADTRLEDQEVLQTVAEGHPLTAKDVAPAPLVRKGAMVDVVAVDGALSVSMKGLAMATGALGDAITVRNLDTHKDFSAKVVQHNSVRVTF